MTRHHHTTITTTATTTINTPAATVASAPADGANPYRSLKVAVPAPAALAAVPVMSAKRPTMSPHSWYLNQESPSGSSALGSPGPRTGSPPVVGEYADALSPGAMRAGILQPLGSNTGMFTSKAKSSDLSQLSAFENIVGYMVGSSGGGVAGVWQARAWELGMRCLRAIADDGFV